MGMLVDVGSMTSAVIFGIVLSVLAILSKVLGSGIPALLTGFNFLGSARIGVGMTPRGEVALIIAGIGLSQGIIGQNLFGVSIMMTIITTLIAPIILVPLLKNETRGTRKGDL
jgi:Kef-type K+ transport system membrane component KefB